jgi:hypothetical protein
MAGLLDIFGTSGQDTMGLLGMSPEDVQKNRDDAQAQALYALAGRLFQGGRGGASIVEGLQQGQQAYRQAMQGSLQQQLQNAQIQDMLRKRQQEQAALAEQQRIQQVLKRATGPEVFPETPLTNMMGQEVAGPNMPQPKGMGLTQDVVNQLIGSQQGQVALGQMADLMPKLRRAGIGVEQKPEDNPFLVFTQDETIPKNVQTLAQQYAKSWSSGRLDPDVADKRFSELTAMAQRVQDRDAAQANLKAQQEQMNEFKRQGLEQSAQARTLANQIALGNQAIQKMTAEFNISQKQEKAQEKADVKADAKKQLSDVVSQLKNSYDTLLEGGGITSTGSGGRENIGAKMGTSAVGQFMGSALGTKNQEQRQIIEQTRPLLLNLIKEATGMSASQMNSNAEMQMYLKAATDPKLSYEANVTALQNLDKTFGLGLLKDISPPKKKQQTTSSSWGPQ